jgi:hypothetical protein
MNIVMVTNTFIHYVPGDSLVLKQFVIKLTTPKGILFRNKIGGRRIK